MALRAATTVALAAALLATLAGCETHTWDIPEDAVGPLPAGVQDVLGSSCQQCHGAIPLYGAPMSLVRAEDFHQPAPSQPWRPVWQLVPERLTNPQAPMPPLPLPPIDSTSSHVLLDWIARGALADPTAIVEGAAGAPAPPPPTLTTTTTDDCEASIELRAHAVSETGDETPYRVRGPADFQRCFLFKAPADGPLQASRIEVIVDNPSVIHHVSVGAIENPGPTTFDGKVSYCSPLEDHIDYPMAFWTPGASPTEVPDDVGLRLPRGDAAYYMLQVHYFTLDGEHEDQSGMRICGVRQPRAHEAAIHVFGSEAFEIPAGTAANVSADCAVQGDQPAHVLAVLPHMHLLGRSMTLERVRSDGTAQLLQDEPFDFFNQLVYPVDWELEPGERLRTTCHFENPTPFNNGYGIQSFREMCYAFAVVYPFGSLTDPEDATAFPGCVDR